MVEAMTRLPTFLWPMKDDKNDVVAWAIRLGKEHRLTSCSVSSSSMARRLHRSMTRLHSSEARFSFFLQRRSEASVTRGHLLDTSSEASILMCAISSLSMPSSSLDSWLFFLPMRKVEILLTASPMTAEATTSDIRMFLQITPACL
uniref:Uncharacterized protein n=1 Tax=Oryza brachyantha TaxID=4533 RepID=J3MI82_ORYBR